jgi:hypothetical protein
MTLKTSPSKTIPIRPVCPFPWQKKAQGGIPRAFVVRRLAIPYFRTANCRTIIGAKRFHFRVRDGIGWCTLAMVTKQFGVQRGRKALGKKLAAESFRFTAAPLARLRPAVSCPLTQPLLNLFAPGLFGPAFFAPASGLRRFPFALGLLPAMETCTFFLSLCV